MWRIDSWKTKPCAHEVAYDDARALERATEKLRRLPPLVTSFEVERLKGLLAEAQAGKRFVLQGGDCAETLDDCRPEAIAAKLKILLQMSLILVQAGKKPVVRIGRFAGQYAKPRSSPTEERGNRSLPSYFGDLVNRAQYTEEARRADPAALVEAYHHAAHTLNFVRSLTAAGFADFHHPEYWDLGFLSRAGLSDELRDEYAQAARQLAESLAFMGALGETHGGELSRVDFYTSHEGLSLPYESAQTRRVPRRDGHYLLTTHMPWIGDRTRHLGGAHVEFFRGIENAVGIKAGPSASPEDIVELISCLNPSNAAGKIAIITRLGSREVERCLPPLVDAVLRASRRVLWVCDPMHGNTTTTARGTKTRDVGAILHELEQSFAILAAQGTHLGGVHLELTGEDVTECVGAGLTEDDLAANYTSACDPRLNYRQALETAFRIGRCLRASEGSKSPGTSG